MAYIDDWRSVAAQLCLSTTGIWFDIVTSIPWSFMDLHAYLVGTPFLVAMTFRTDEKYSPGLRSGGTNANNTE